MRTNKASVTIIIIALAVVHLTFHGLAIGQLPESKAPAVDDETWARRLHGLGDDWRRAYQVAQQVTKLPAERGYAIVRDNWDRIESPDTRRQIIKAWYFSTLHAPRAY